MLDMSTETFIWCLKRFAARRELHQRFISDNGMIFNAALKYLKSIFKDDTVHAHGMQLDLQCGTSPMMEWSF